ncbi:MAG TPA: hypothetical protein VFE36_01435 [Candidatus Baltobacteraceae bacterium]|nr:hypothetical protein [Candidatus Baltobacteraceae bacterium]
MKRIAALVLATAVGGCGGIRPVPATTVASAYAIPAAGIRFFVKGVAYSPAPIGKTVGDAPLLDDPLRDGNQAIWSRDLPKMRAMGVNAIHVYNVVGPPGDTSTGPISKFLTAAYNGGKQPIYVLMSIYFTGDKLLDAKETAAIAKKYHDLDAKYAKSPAVLGITISNEIGLANYIQNKTWWKNFNVVANAARKGFDDGGGSGKIVTTSEIDGDIAVVRYGEQNGAAVDVWGVNIYRGRTFTTLFTQIEQYTKKPVLLTEWGASAAFHPGWKNTYSWQNAPDGVGVCTPADPKGSTTRSDVKDLPASGNPKMAGLVDLIQNDASLLYSAWKKNGVVSGGFYFEWNDEWWKAGSGDPSIHYGSLVFKNYFPGCSDDQGWYGLNAVKKNGNAVDVLAPRPGLAILQSTWAKQR